MVLIDFGIARLFKSVRKGTMIDTLGFAPPALRRHIAARRRPAAASSDSPGAFSAILTMTNSFVRSLGQLNAQRSLSKCDKYVMFRHARQSVKNGEDNPDSQSQREAIEDCGPA